MDKIHQFENMMLVALPADRLPTEEEIDELGGRLRAVFPLSDEDYETVIHRVHARVSIRMDTGVVLVEEDLPPWLSARKPEIDPFYWDRFSKWLLKGSWPPRVITSLDSVTDNLLDLLGDPQRSGQWRRRGLVIGDVQSGKTATYTALCCKAADAGYRLIVLLTGTLESLRRQTQERLDEGFVGLDSSDILTRRREMKASRVVGAGSIDSRRTAGVFTSRQKDFSRALMTALGFRLDAFNEPVLMVVKKNKKILENLEDWLRSYNAGQDGLIDAPILLIDDEADNASVNTNAPGADPTAINERIRSILQLFTRSSYIGFTATPFANIFIDPETEHEMLGHDLFPRQFVYCLDAPNNYLGPVAMFDDESKLDILRTIVDAEASFPPRHKSSLQVTALPESLMDAVLSFILTTTIRDLRREGPTHRSMLVNVSRFTAVQDQVASTLDAAVRQMQADIRSYSQLPEAQATRNTTLAELHQTWSREFSSSGFEWEVIQKALLQGALPITVRAVNQRTGAASLDYKAHKETGLRVIAVGGNSLSRGLTLEGLSTSYFFRNSQMYDTLLQMGRWFGYRDGYGDLCRLWLTADAAQWYAHITMAGEELRSEVQRMRQLKRTPRDFGLKVRAHPDSLIVTARNKMRQARNVERVISVSGEGMETSRLRLRGDSIKNNALAVERFLQDLKGHGITPTKSPWNNTFWTDVPSSLVASLLRRFEPHPLNMSFQPSHIADSLEGGGIPALELWDVVLPEGSERENPVTIGAMDIAPLRRKVETVEAHDCILVSGRKARIGSRGIEREGIPKDEVDSAKQRFEKEHEGKSIPDKEYRNIRKRPLLLLYVVRPYEDGTVLDTNGHPLVGLGLSFPHFNDTDLVKKIKYSVNLVEWRRIFEGEVDDEIEDDEELDVD